MARKKTSTELVDIQKEIQNEVATIADRITAPTGVRIKYDSRGFTLPDGQTNDTLSIVILDFVAANRLYMSNFDPGDVTPPDCFAVGRVRHEALKPMNTVPKPENHDCNSCPNWQWGTGTGGKGKLCKSRYLLAAVPGESDSPDDAIFILDVSTMSLKTFSSYVSACQSRFDTLPIGVVTEVTIDENSPPNYGILNFNLTSPNENLAVHWSRRDEASKILLAGPDFSVSEKPKKPARATKKKVAKKKASRKR